MSIPIFDTKIEIRENEPLSKYSSFKIGGNAKYAVFPHNKEELISAFKASKESGMKYKIIGHGSNVLFDDNGFDGIIIFTKHMTGTEYIHKKDVTLVHAECGKPLTELSADAGRKHSLSGLEFAYGIPGSVGGAVYMNAGAYGGKISDVVVESEYFNTSTEEIVKIDHIGHQFSYRHSIFHDHPEYIVISTTLMLKESSPQKIHDLMTKNISSRREKQPLEYPNAGSTFKRPEGHFAGKLIEDAGLKGYTVGGAQVSEKHAGFVINRGNAKSQDVLNLMDHIKKIVMEKYSVELESEIIYIPY